MADIVLRDPEQRALGALLLSEPVPGDPLPSLRVLETIARIIPCDSIGVDLADHAGRVLAGVTLAGPRHDERDPQVCDGPLWLGLVHVSRMPIKAPLLAKGGLADSLLLGFRNGSDCIVQLVLERTNRPFSARDVAMLHLISPIVQRLVRERPTPSLPANLTLAERRALMHVAAGRSNTEIAQHLSVAPSTVRKHLENAYRKLGVHNRLAAVVALQGRDLPDPDLRERIERFA